MRCFYKNVLDGRPIVIILIDETTLMNKSNLSTNNFGNNHFGQKYQKQNIFRIFRLKWCLFEKIPTNRTNTKKPVSGQIFHSFENFITLKN